jgi:3-methylcrotonyl-CoA carboxylase alpha subunit
MFDTLLIANRGEIACRVMRSARALGLRTVAVYSDADADALHVQEADTAVRLGPAPARDSYLAIDRLIEAARVSGAQAVHPGYGFLSENAAFAQAVTDAGLIFVGPSAAVIETMGSKIAAKETVGAAGTPVVPGYLGEDQSEQRLRTEAQAMGFPLLIKASAGGGGKGMRIVSGLDEFDAALASARREASAAFGDDKVLLERYLTAPKHLEVQILADQQGNTLHLFERDCSLQRRHQKVVEEAPGATVSDELRARLGEAAVKAARAVGYCGAGTVEFVAEGDEFFFMEMNTRLQVEHPVTEAITGLDLVAWQLRVAAGLPLPFVQDELRANGHAIEVRLYAENPRRKFLPASGPLEHLQWPETVRVDSGVRSGDAVTPHYDPMLAKIIAHGKDRETARRKLVAALRQTQVAGIAHNVDYLVAVLGCAEFRSGDYTTGTLGALQDALAPPLTAAQLDRAAIAALVATTPAPGFRLNQPARRRQCWQAGKEVIAVAQVGSTLSVEDRSYALAGSDCKAVRPGLWQVSLTLDEQRFDATVVQAAADHSDTLFVVWDGLTVALEPWQAQGGDARERGFGREIRAPMPGQVIAVHASVGQAVSAGDALIVMEAMKMEHTLPAPGDGAVARITVAVGSKVGDGDLLLALDDAQAAEGTSES